MHAYSNARTMGDGDGEGPRVVGALGEAQPATDRNRDAAEMREPCKRNAGRRGCDLWQRGDDQAEDNQRPASTL